MAETHVSNKRRLNPFAFPSETNVRFTLLVVAAVMLAFGIIQSQVPLPDTPKIEIAITDRASVEQGLMEWGQTLTQAVIGLALPCAFALAIVILAMLIYRDHAKRIRRGKNLRLLTRSEDARFLDAVQDAVRLSDISPAPSIETAAGSRSVDGQAFGFRDHYALRLGGGLRLLLRQNVDSFRAIVLHELAHIANADITRTYFAQAIWIAFIILMVIPAISFITIKFMQGLIEKLSGGLTSAEWIRLFTLNVPTVLIFLFQVAATLAIVAAIRSSLLRVREIYADWRAALWGAEVPLSNILRRTISEDKAGRWSRLWRLHPTSQERLAALQNPYGLFRVTNDLSFFVGVLLAYILHNAYYFGLVLLAILQAGQTIGTLQFSKSLDNPPISIEALFLISFALDAVTMISVLALGFWIVYLIAGALGLQVQREALADLVAGRRGWGMYLSLWKPSALTAIGFQVGSLLTPLSFFALLPELFNLRGLLALFVLILLTAAFAFLTWLGLVYMRFFARRIIGWHVGVSSPQAARRLLTLVLSVLLLTSYLPSLIGQSIIQGVVLGDTSTMSFGNTAIQTQTILTQVLGVTIAAALLLYFVAFSVTWLSMQAYRLLWQPRCPTCRQATKIRYAVGQACEHCGQELAPWLFVNEPTRPDTI